MLAERWLTDFPRNNCLGSVERVPREYGRVCESKASLKAFMFEAKKKKNIKNVGRKRL
jgi:hypothetical protein